MNAIFRPHTTFIVAIVLCFLPEAALAEEQKAGLQFTADVFARFPNGNVVRISPGNGIYYQACINPQGTFVAYSGGTGGPPRIWVTNIETKLTRPLTPEGVFAIHPVFSWDGSSIAFAADFAHDQVRLTLDNLDTGGEPTTKYKLSIYVCDSNGDNLRRITKGDWFDRRPTFSPDGGQIAFVSNRNGGKYELWRADCGGTSDPQEVLPDDIGYRPWYSTDGKTLYFFSIIDGKHRLCSVAIKGGKKSPIEDEGPGDSRGPFVDPTCNSLLTHSNRKGDWQIYELPLDGKPPKKVTLAGIDEARHATRAKNGIMAFDVIAGDSR